MGRDTAISWCDHTFNPWIGCAKVSPACDGCYAEALMGTTGRHKRAAWGGPGLGAGTRSRTAPGTWRQPLGWNATAQRDGTRPFVFCASLADVFDNQVDPAWRADLFALIAATPHLVWLLLTKRPGNIVKLFLEHGPAEGWPPNAAIGCTVATQAEADRDIPILLDAKRALKPAFAFVSIEPMLEWIDMRRWLPSGRPAIERSTGLPFIAPHFYMTICPSCGWAGSSEFCGTDSGGDDSDVYCPACHRGGLGDDFPTLDWVIAGGETDQGGHKARPSHPDWFRGLRNQCAAADIPFHFKQWGAYRPSTLGTELNLVNVDHDGRWERSVGQQSLHQELMARVGDKRGSRALDAAIHDARPEIQP